MLQYGMASEDFTNDPDQVDLAVGDDEFALAFIAEADSVRQVFFSRSDSAARPLFVTFSASGGGTINPRHPVLVRIDDGYSVFWVEEGTSQPQLYHRRFVCGR